MHFMFYIINVSPKHLKCETRSIIEFKKLTLQKIAHSPFKSTILHSILTQGSFLHILTDFTLLCVANPFQPIFSIHAKRSLGAFVLFHVCISPISEPFCFLNN
jgi:hypothetical protein